jgi:hypothetical protein
MKTFTKPLKTTNLHEGTKEQYNACPYCLTEIINVEIENENAPMAPVTEAIVSDEIHSKKESNEDIIFNYFPLEIISYLCRI